MPYSILFIIVFILAGVSLVCHVKLRELLKSVDGWKQKWESTPKWLHLGSGATSFDYRVQFAVLTGSLLSSTNSRVRKLAKYYGIILYSIIFIAGYLMYVF